jgi:phage major head subunit gpT-like protein
MALVNQAQLDASQISFSARFAQVLEAVEDPVRQIAMELPSSGAVEEYDWLGQVPGLTEWLDDRKLSPLRAEGFQIVNKNWANGIRVKTTDIADDRLGIVRPRIDSLARKAGLHYGQLIGDFLVSGRTTTLGVTYDGVALISASHVDGDVTQSNLGTAALADASYDTARAAMQSLTDENGDNLGLIPTHLLVGPTLERTALEVTQAGVIPSTAGTASITNVFAGTARTIVSPKLSGAYAAYWFLLDLSQPIRPLILQIREPIQFAAMDQPTNMPRFMRNQLLYGADGRHNVGYGFWQTIWGSDGTT